MVLVGLSIETLQECGLLSKWKSSPFYDSWADYPLPPLPPPPPLLPPPPPLLLPSSSPLSPLLPSSSPGCGYIRCEKGGDILSQDWYPYSWYCGEHERLRLSSLLGQ